MPTVRARLALAGLLLCTAPWLLLPGAAARPAAKTRPVTLQLSNNGLGAWSIDSPDDKGQLALRYHWAGSLKFNIPTKALKDPAKTRFKSHARTTLKASWIGVFTGRKLTGLDAGPYRCEYKGADVPALVDALLSNGKKRGTLQLVLHPAAGAQQFFSPKGQGATVTCTTARGDLGPTHFDPKWLFRDTVTDHGFLSSDTAVIDMPSKLLPRRSVTLRFPREIGRRNSPFLGKINWNNRGKLVVKAR
jgi:hypothetical protein